MLAASDFRQQARNALEGNWGIAVITGVVATLLGAGSSLDSSINSVVEKLSDGSSWSIVQNMFHSGYRGLFLGIAGTAGLWFLVMLILGGAITLGYSRFNLNLIDHASGEFKDLFSYMDRLVDGFLMEFFMGLYIFLWTLLLIIPGIIAAYSYALTPYIMAGHPELTAREAIRRSKEMMNGNRWRLFCLHISFLGWAILATITLGIGFLWLSPYIEAAEAAFYREIAGEI